jgi:hypothetical protein
MNYKKSRISWWRYLSLQAIILGLCLASRSSIAQTLGLTPNLIKFNSPDGEKLFLDSHAKEDYFPLSVQFVTQDNQAFCGVASMVMVLNALGIPAPKAFDSSNYHYFTQNNFFDNAQTHQVLSPEVVSRRGMTLLQLSQFLEAYPVKATVYYGGDVTLDEFRSLVVQNLGESNNFVLVNYFRSAIGQEGGGHISPVAAYNKETDRFLILDVSRYKYPPIWVKASELWEAIRTVDRTSGKTRGFVLVSPL